MKKIFPAALTLALAAVLCGSAANAALTPGVLTIWVKSDKNYNGIAEVGKNFTAQTGTKVIVEHPADLEDLATMFVREASAGAGPDIIMWAHDRFGDWVNIGLLSPLQISDDVKGRFANFSWDAMTVDGKIYGYPMSIEALSMLCNNSLVPEQPKNFEDFGKLDDQLKAQGARAILWDYNQVYYTYLLMAAQGGYAFKNTDGSYDITDTGVNNEGSIAAVKFLKEMLDNDQLQKGASYDMADKQFAQGKLGCTINGPWSWARYEEAGIDMSVYPLPNFGGKKTKSFVGVQGLVINTKSPNKAQARDFIENYLLTDEGLQIVSMEKDLGLAALTSYANVQEQDDRVAMTMENAKNGEVMPSTSQMSLFWDAMNVALKDVFTGHKLPEASLNIAAKRITSK